MKDVDEMKLTAQCWRDRARFSRSVEEKVRCQRMAEIFERAAAAHEVVAELRLWGSVSAAG